MSVRKFLFPVPLVLLLAGCASIPDSYPVPVQRGELTGAEPDPVGAVVNSNDANADAYYVKDVSNALEGGVYRWAHQRPEFRFRVKSNQNVKFVMDFAIVGATFDKTGPVTYTYTLDGKLLDRVRYDAPGQKHFEKAVPPAMLSTDHIVSVVVEPDKAYTADDGVVLSFTLTRIGFVE